MKIADYKRGGNVGALFNHGNGTFSACTACESSRYFKTERGAAAWLNKRGYKRVN